ncbi:MAG: cysteine hydrolase [Candidatus Methanomethylophilaceae archaeon]|nr:cysteine hydrolase [Candidatus Methanomethylophilaceae archaeon]
MYGKLDTLNRAIRLFRDTGNPIVYVYFDGDGHGTEGVERPDDLIDGLIGPVDGDRIVHKRYMNSFRGTDLDRVLEDTGCDGVVLAGLVARFCVLSTYFGVFDHDLRPYILSGGVASTVESHIGNVEAICNVTTVDEIRSNIHFSAASPSNR